jgi:hypothetical protein
MLRGLLPGDDRARHRHDAHVPLLSHQGDAAEGAGQRGRRRRRGQEEKSDDTADDWGAGAGGGGVRGPYQGIGPELARGVSRAALLMMAKERIGVVVRAFLEGEG